jgi:hypothetical protein
MTAAPVPTSSLLDDALADVDREIAETERRRERQVHLLRDLDQGTKARTCAERLLCEIDWTLSLNHMRRTLIQNLLATETSKDLGDP